VEEQAKEKLGERLMAPCDHLRFTDESRCRLPLPGHQGRTYRGGGEGGGVLGARAGPGVAALCRPCFRSELSRA
jgi:hypothetical protein